MTSSAYRQGRAADLHALQALGTHAGLIHVLDEQGNRIKHFRSHTASVLDLAIDDTDEFVASAGMDGLVAIHSLSAPETYNFDFQRPMRCIALEPGFGRRSTRAFVCGGLAGNLVLREKSWFGHRETILHSGEGAIWAARWKGTYIAWANEKVRRRGRGRRGAALIPLHTLSRRAFGCTTRQRSSA